MSRPRQSLHLDHLEVDRGKIIRQTRQDLHDGELEHDLLVFFRELIAQVNKLVDEQAKLARVLGREDVLVRLLLCAPAKPTP